MVIAVRDLRSGTVLRSDDLAVSTWPSALAPPGASTRIADLVGRRSGGPIAAGEAVTATRLLSASAAEIPPGRVVTSLPGLDPAIVAWIDVGRTVDVLEPGTGNVLAHDAAIVVAPRPGRQPAETWSMADHDPADGTLVVTVTEAEARSIAAAAGDLDRPVVVVVHPRAAG